MSERCPWRAGGPCVTVLSLCPISWQCFDQKFYDSLSEDMQTRFLRCLASGYENPDSGMGCYACFVVH
jgi:hypothetical protein